MHTILFYISVFTSMISDSKKLVDPPIRECLRQLQLKNKTSSMPLEFRREFCVEDAIRHSKKQKFDPLKQIKVTQRNYI